MTGPSAGPSRCAVCTVPIDWATRSLGDDSAAMARHSGPYPANRPWMARRAKRCQGCVTQAMAAMITTKLASERATRSLRPNRSARRPHAGASSAVIAGVTPSVKPVQSAIDPTSRTPSSAMYSGRNGITSVKPVKPMKLAAVSAARLRRQARTGSLPAAVTPPGRCTPVRMCPSEPDLHVVRIVDVNAVDEAHLPRIRLHDQRLRACAVAEEPDALHQ